MLIGHSRTWQSHLETEPNEINKVQVKTAKWQVVTFWTKQDHLKNAFDHLVTLYDMSDSFSLYSKCRRCFKNEPSLYQQEYWKQRLALLYSHEVGVERK